MIVGVENDSLIIHNYCPRRLLESKSSGKRYGLNIDLEYFEMLNFSEDIPSNSIA